MGDQSKLVLLKEVVKVIQEEGLLQRVQEAGRVLLSGLENIQVIYCVQEIRAFLWSTNEAPHAFVTVLRGPKMYIGCFMPTMAQNISLKILFNYL